MSLNRQIKIVHPDYSRLILAQIKGVNSFSRSEKKISWKKQVITKNEVAKNPQRLLFRLEDKGQLLECTKEQMLTYTFKKEEIGNYVKLYAYIENFESIQQSTIFYVEDRCNTNIRIRGVKRIDSDSSEKVAVGQKIKLKVNEYNVSENKVSDSVKKNIKWMIKVGNEADERLFIDGLVVTGDEIEFSVPEEWAEREVILMPYLNIHTPKISCKFMCDEMYIPSCGGTWVKPIESGKYQVLDVFLGRDNSNRIFYIDSNNIVTIGYSLTPYSFLNTDGDEKDWQPFGIIDINNSTGGAYLNDKLNTNMSHLSYLIHYMINAIGYKLYDFKRTEGKAEYVGDEKAKYKNTEEYYRGMFLNNIKVPNVSNKKVFASARDIGNIHAGMVAACFGLSWKEARAGFDALQTLQVIGVSPKELVTLGYTFDEYKKIVKDFSREYWIAAEGPSTQYAQRFGFNIGRVISEERQKVKTSKEMRRIPGNGHYKIYKIDNNRINAECRILTENEKF